MIRKSNIWGFQIPGQLERLKVQLFADDTSAFLSEFDEYSTLERILRTWCMAAKARFNIQKMEIILVGSARFREEFTAAYKATGRWRDYPPNVRVAVEGSVVRILGAFFGNGIDDCGVWAPILDKGRHHVIQFTAAGGMPDHILRRLRAITRNFLWKGNEHPTVALEQLHQPYTTINVMCSNNTFV
ncbi:hypothetical protein GGG16DRAFT_129578 [Schizophyllum commune]